MLQRWTMQLLPLGPPQRIDCRFVVAPKLRQHWGGQPLAGRKVVWYLRFLSQRVSSGRAGERTKRQLAELADLVVGVAETSAAMRQG